MKRWIAVLWMLLLVTAGAETPKELGLRALEEDRLVDAIKHFTSALNDEGADKAELYRLRAEAYLDNHQNKQSARDATEALKLNPKDAEALVVHGLAQGGLGNFGKAREEIEAAAKLAPKNSFVVWRHGQMYCSMGNLKKADTLMSQAIEISPNNARLYVARAEIRNRARLLQAALKDSQKAQNLGDNSVEGYFNHAATYHHMKQPQKAILLYQKALKLNPGHEMAWGNLALCYSELGRHQEALDAIEKGGGARNPHLYYLNRGIFLLDLGRPKEARASFEQVLKLPGNRLKDNARYQLKKLDESVRP